MRRQRIAARPMLDNNRCFGIKKIDGLGQEIERASVHCGANIGHVAIGRDDDGRELFRSPAASGGAIARPSAAYMSATTASTSRLASSSAKASTPSWAKRKLTVPSQIWCRNFCWMSASKSGCRRQPGCVVMRRFQLAYRFRCGASRSRPAAGSGACLYRQGTLLGTVGRPRRPRPEACPDGRCERFPSLIRRLSCPLC